MTTEDKRNRPTIPASACPKDSLLTARCNLELERRRDAEQHRANVEAMLRDITLRMALRQECRAFVREPARNQVLAVLALRVLEDA